MRWLPRLGQNIKGAHLPIRRCRGYGSENKRGYGVGAGREGCLVLLRESGSGQSIPEAGCGIL